MSDVQYWIITLFAAAALILVLTAVVLAVSTGRRQHRKKRYHRRRTSERITASVPQQPQELPETQGMHEPQVQAIMNTATTIRHEPFLPLLLGLLALVIWFSLQAWVLFDERSRLREAHASQQQTVDNAGKLRQSLDGLATDTQRLADAGNPSARLLVEELRKRGVTINPNAQQSTKN